MIPLHLSLKDSEVVRDPPSPSTPALASPPTWLRCQRTRWPSSCKACHLQLVLSLPSPWAFSSPASSASPLSHSPACMRAHARTRTHTIPRPSLGPTPGLHFLQAKPAERAVQPSAHTASTSSLPLPSGYTLGPLGPLGHSRLPLPGCLRQRVRVRLCLARPRSDSGQTSENNHSATLTLECLGFLYLTCSPSAACFKKYFY